MNRRAFIRRAGWVSTGLIFVPKLLRADNVTNFVAGQGIGLGETISTTPSGSGSGGDITTGLAAWFKLDDGSGTNAADSSGNANNGTVVGSPAWTTGQVNGALTLNGSSQYVNLPNAVPALLYSATACTLCCWFKGTFVQSAIRLQTDNTNFVILGWSTSSPQCIISSDGGTTGVAIAGVQDGNWHHVAMTWQKNTTNGFKVYVDKTLSAQRNSANANLPTGTSNFSAALGRYGGGASGGEYLTGTIDDCRIYTRALSATDIASLP